MPPLFASPLSVICAEITMPLSCLASTYEPLHAVPSGEEMVEERGVPVHEDWSMAPDDDRVRFSLSGVAPHSWKRSPWEGWDGGYSAWMTHLLQASLWMEEEPGGAIPSSLSDPKPPPNLLPTQCLDSLPAHSGQCSPPHAGLGTSSWRPSALTQCTTSHPPLRAG